MLFPHLSTDTAELRAIEAHGASGLRELLRTAGVTELPCLDLFAATLAGASEESVAAQFLVGAPPDGATAGAVSLFDLDLNSGHVRAGVCVDQRSGAETDATLLAVNYAFASWSVRKVYFWSSEEKIKGFTDADGAIVHEATLPEFLYAPEGLLNAHIFAVYRKDWLEFGVKSLGIRF